MDAVKCSSRCALDRLFVEDLTKRSSEMSATLFFLSKFLKSELDFHRGKTENRSNVRHWRSAASNIVVEIWPASSFSLRASFAAMSRLTSKSDPRNDSSYENEG